VRRWLRAGGAGSLVQIVLQLSGAGRMTQFTQCFRFDLSDPLAGDTEFSVGEGIDADGDAVSESVEMMVES